MYHTSGATHEELLTRLSEPFQPSAITWKPGAAKENKCMAMAYADLRAYQNRLDEVCGLGWSVRYVPWGDERIMCELTIDGVTRTSTGEYDAQNEKNNIEGTVAEAQAFKRACAMFGLGRYLYDLPSVWIEFDAQRKRITEAGQTELANRYKAWYAKFAKEQAARSAGNDPTDVEMAIIAKWANRTEAEIWAVQNKSCRNEAHARNSMDASIKHCGGTVTKDNYICVYTHFLRRQMEKLNDMALQAAVDAEPIPA
jgi:Uncharacterized protein conserved in bacteria